MKISYEIKDDTAIVSITGEVDMQSSPDARSVFLSLVKKEVGMIIVDLKGVSYIDSSGLATLVECLQNMKKYGGRLRLAGLTPEVRDIFELAKLHKIFDIYDNIQDALLA